MEEVRIVDGGGEIAGRTLHSRGIHGGGCSGDLVNDNPDGCVHNMDAGNGQSIATVEV